MAEACSLAARHWSKSSSYLCGVPSSDFCEEVFDESSPANELQHEQEERASDELEAAIFAHLQASTFSDPFAQTWSQRAIYFAGMIH
eukprot:1499792-Rhodomonas_salina.1